MDAADVEASAVAGSLAGDGRGEIFVNVVVTTVPHAVDLAFDETL